MSSFADLLPMVWQISWQAAVIALLVLALQMSLGRLLTARWRHALWALVLCRLLMPALPQSRASLFRFRSIVEHAAPARQSVLPRSDIVTPGLVSPVHTSVHYGPVPVTPVSETATAPAPRQSRLPAILLTVWLTIGVGLVARLLWINRRFQRSLRGRSVPVDRELVSLLEECCHTMKVRRAPGLIITDLVETPAACGVFRPRILLPAAIARDLPDDQLRLVFLHELAHIQCHDVAVDWIWSVLLAMHWFNPLLWLTGPLRRNDREMARDECVLSITEPGQAGSYGRVLLELAGDRRLPSFCPGLVGMFTGHRCLRRRVSRIAAFTAPPKSSAWIGLAVLAVGGCCSLTAPQKAAPPQAAKSAPGSTARSTTAAADSVNDPAEPIDPDSPRLSPEDQAATQKLDRNLPEVRFAGNSLNDVIDFLRKSSDLNIYVDWAALQRAGVPRDAAVTVRTKDCKLSKVIQLVFQSVQGDGYEHQLGYVLDQGVVTITTRPELDKNVETRKYDINDLMFVAANYDSRHIGTDPPATTQADAMAKRTARIKMVIDQIRSGADPNSWKDNGGTVGSISSSPLRAVLLITTTPDRHRKVRAVLAALRAAQGPQISIETHFITIADDEFARLPEELRAKIASTDGRVTINNEDWYRISHAVKDDENLTAPRLTLFNGQHAVLALMGHQGYVPSWSRVETTSGGKTVTTFEPHAATFDVGLSLDVVAAASPDRSSVSVDLRPQLSRLAGVISRPWDGAPPEKDLMVEYPVLLRSVTQATDNIDNGTIRLFQCGAFVGIEPPPVSDARVAAEIDRAHNCRVFMLVKPRILRERSAAE